MYDLRDPKFYDENEVEAELRRVFDVCHTCRMCFNYCPSFPSLFDAIDRHERSGEGEVDALTKPELDEVVDLCYQCKLCYVKCPYTPPHKFMLDFPRLMLRAKAARAKRAGVTLPDRFLGNPDLSARRSTGPLARFVNWMNRQRVVRVLMERTVGIHRDRMLPEFATETFEKWMKRHRQPNVAGENRVAIFETCSVNYNYPNIGIAAVQVLERNGKTVLRPRQVCCGMPALDGGDVDLAVANARKNVDVLYPLVKEGVPILVLGPTCGYVIKKEWPDLLGTEEAKAVAEKTFDIGEYLAKEKAAGRLDTSFSVPQGKLAYHIPCHLRAQNIGQPFRQVLGAIPETSVEAVEQCSAVDGTWGLKKEYYTKSRQCAGKLCAGMKNANADRMISDCMLAGLNVLEELGTQPAHPIEVLRDAYGMSADDAK
ncbi:MAG: heterodisulfide reductase-related iron-sulfur binding cluster [Thermoanaerobaculia bacterium]